MTYVRNVKEISTDRNDRKIYIERKKESKYNVNLKSRRTDTNRKTQEKCGRIGRKMEKQKKQSKKRC
jgi:hypothetical protein